jgi:hypothetical protein
MTLESNTKDDLEFVRECIDNEGFDYCFDGYSHFPGIKSIEFHQLREEYLTARKKLEDFIG